jgi:phosphatidylglycerol:prolipoprotein diacylglycerol transferase
MMAIFLYLRLRGLPLLRVADAGAPALMLAYGIGRLGCHLAGDGDYGRPTGLPWGTRYDGGLVPPSRAFSGMPEILAGFPSGVVPDDVPCHPTPVYEFGLAALICAALLLWGRRSPPDGSVFCLYLVLSSAERFAIEFLRLNPPVAFGLTEAQLIGTALGLIGLGGLVYRRARALEPKAAAA